MYVFLLLSFVAEICLGIKSITIIFARKVQTHNHA